MKGVIQRRCAHALAKVQLSSSSFILKPGPLSKSRYLSLIFRNKARILFMSSLTFPLGEDFVT